jgi:glycine/D-amino acid oxidase-like deaminating enzyme
MRLARRTDALIVFVEDEAPHRLQAIRDLYLSLGVRARIASAEDLKSGPYRRACGIVLSDHGMTDPAKLAKALSEKLAAASVPVASMVTALRVREADGGAVVETDCGEIRARVVLAATSGRPLEGVPSLDVEHRLSGGVLAERQAGDAWDIDKALYMDAGQHAFSARIVTGDRLLFGRSRAVGGSTVAKAASELMTEIEEEFARRLPGARILSRWYGPTFREPDFRAGFTLGTGGRVARLFACNGRGLLTGFLLGKHVGYSLAANAAMPPCQASFPEFPSLLDA